MLCFAAAAGGHVPILQWVLTEGHDVGAIQVARAAAAAGHLAVLQWCQTAALLDTSDTKLCRTAGEEGHVHIVQWLHAQQCVWNALTSETAAARGRLEFLQWVIQQDCPWDPINCFRVARQWGQWQCAEWIKTQPAYLAAVAV